MDMFVCLTQKAGVCREGGLDDMLAEDQFNEMVRLLYSDIGELIPLVFPHNKPVREASIRLMAVLMRRWLVDGDLQKLTSHLKSEVKFKVQCNESARAYAKDTNAFTYFLTAGVMMDGRPVSYIYDSPLHPELVQHNFILEGCQNLSLKKFLAQPRMFHEGRWFTTAQILRFVANKLGGNHVDFDRSGEWEGLDIANKYLAYGGPILSEPPKGTTIYLILESASKEIIGGVHLEVIAAAASFVQMEIDGHPLCQLKSESTFVNTIRKFLRKSPKAQIIYRKS